MANAPASIVPFYSLTLGDPAAPRAALVASCGACRRLATVDVLPLLAKLGSDFGVIELQRGLRCEVCRRKRFTFVRVEWL